MFFSPGTWTLSVPQCPIAFSILPLCANTKSNQQCSTERVWLVRRRFFCVFRSVHRKINVWGMMCCKCLQWSHANQQLSILDKSRKPFFEECDVKLANNWEAENCTVWHNGQDVDIFTCEVCHLGNKKAPKWSLYFQKLSWHVPQAPPLCCVLTHTSNQTTAHLIAPTLVRNTPVLKVERSFWFHSAPVGTSNRCHISFTCITFGMYTFSQAHTRTRWIASRASPLHREGHVKYSPFPGMPIDGW